MFSLSYSAPSYIHGTIVVNKITYGLGPIIDIFGRRWHVRGHFGTWVQAELESCVNAYFTNTASDVYHGIVDQTWKPYRLIIMDDLIQT